MAHLGVSDSGSSSSESPSDMDLCSEPELYEIPSPTYVAPLPAPSKKERGKETPPTAQLHLEVEKFSKLLEMDAEELRRKRELIQIVTDTSYKLFKAKHPELKVQPFGGFSNGLATKKSDLDIVLTGMFQPDGDQGGYSDGTKRLVTRCLDSLLRGLHIPLKHRLLIRHARIPILKLQTEDGIDLDVSVGNHGGPDAATFIKKHVDRFPVLRPLVLVIKYLLRARSLNDVAEGGLGTYAVANMAIAYVRDIQEKKKEISDYGSVLLGFLQYYGGTFNVKTQAIALRKGSFCQKRETRCSDLNQEGARRYRLCIEDYFTGNDVSGGTAKVMEILRLFGSVHYALVQNMKAPASEKQGSSFPLLASVIDVYALFPKVSALEKDGEIPCQEWPSGRKRSVLKEATRGREAVIRPRQQSLRKVRFQEPPDHGRRTVRLPDLPDAPGRVPRPPPAVDVPLGKNPPFKNVTMSQLSATIFIAPAEK